MMLVSNDGIGQELDLMHTERNGYGKLMLILGPSVVYILYVIEREGERERDRERERQIEREREIDRKVDR
jgi:hypothetical protein